MKKRVLKISAIILLVIVLVTSMTIIPTGYIGVKISFGQVQEETIPSRKLIFTVPFVESIHKVNNKQQDKTVEAQVWGEASDKTPVYAADITITYQIMPERSVWIYANVSDTKNLVTDRLVSSAVKSAMVELGPDEVTKRAEKDKVMVMKEVLGKLNLAFATLRGFLGWFFGGFDGFLYALVVFVTCDYFTGVLAAGVKKELSSEVGFRGIAKKVCIFVLVGVANVLDTQIIGSGSALRTAVVFYFCSNEALSCCENCTVIGLPVPDKLKEMLLQLVDEKHSGKNVDSTDGDSEDEGDKG